MARIPATHFLSIHIQIHQREDVRKIITKVLEYEPGDDMTSLKEFTQERFDIYKDMEDRGIFPLREEE